MISPKEYYKNYTMLMKWIMELNNEVENLREELKEISNNKKDGNKPKIIPMKIEKRVQ